MAKAIAVEMDRFNQIHPELRSWIHTNRVMYVMDCMSQGRTDVFEGRAIAENMGDENSPTRQVFRQAEVVGRKRLEHALKRLKEKKLYVATTGALWNKMSDLPRESAMLMRSLFYVSDPYARGAMDMPISDYCWMAGVELAMMIGAPALFDQSEAYFGSVLEPNIGLIYACVWMCVCTNDIGEQIHRVDDRWQEARTTLESADEVNAALASSKEFLSYAEKKVDRAEAALVQARELSQKREAEWRKDRNRLERLLKEAYDKLGVNADQVPMKEESGLLEEENKVIDEALETVRTMHELPATGVVFVGGDENMTNKLKALHPKWRFIQSDDRQFGPLKDVKVIFLFHKHLGHPTMQRLDAMAPKDAPRIYVDTVNITLLEAQMMLRWTEWLDFGVKDH